MYGKSEKEDCQADRNNTGILLKMKVFCQLHLKKLACIYYSANEKQDR